jgi:hypothetical protein
MNEFEQGIMHRYPMKRYWQIFNIIFGFLALSIELLRRFFSRVIIFWRKEDPYSNEKLPLILQGPRYSYLGIGSKGIVFRFWPLYIVKCKWDNVKLDRSKQKIVLALADVVGVHHFGTHVNPITLSVSAFSKLKLTDFDGKVGS